MRRIEAAYSQSTYEEAEAALKALQPVLRLKESIRPPQPRGRHRRNVDAPPFGAGADAECLFPYDELH